MSERRYSEDEVAQIFERASETRSSALSKSHGSEGLTLAELQDIGSEVGIAPDLVARAARSLDVRAPDGGRRLLGLPIGVGHTVELDRPLTDEEWHRLVVDLRETFDARGRLSDDGAFKQWTNGNLEVLLEPTATGQRLRMRTLKRNAIGMLGSGLILLGIAAVAAVDMTVSNELAQRLPGLLTMLGIGGGLVGINAIRLPAWARLRRSQMREIGERLTEATALPPET
ncbi:MAG: hypothetical protein WEB90_06895 [Gemmatimonadota bacterium]